MKWFSGFKTRMTYVGRMFRILWENDKKFLVLTLFDIVLVAIIPFIGMYLIKFSIDMLARNEDFNRYLPIVLLLLGSSFVVRFLQAIISKHTGVHGNMIGNKLFRAIFNKTLEIDYEMLLNKDILEKRDLAIKVIWQGRFHHLVGNFRLFIANFIILLGIIYILATIEFWILLIVIAIVIVNSVSTSMRKKTERTQHKESVPVNRKIDYFSSVNSDFTYGKEIRTYDMQNSLNTIHQELVKITEKFVKRIFGLGLKSNLIFITTEFCLNAVLYAYLGFKILVQNQISIGDFSLYLNAITTFNNTVQSMVSSYIDISNNGEYLKDYFDYMELKSKYDCANTLSAPLNEELSFVFENVSFTYPYQSKPSLKNINVSINNKEKLSIVGENGSGKTTFVKLLLRLYEPSEGRILLNGVDIKEIDYREYLSMFSTVFQDFKLFAFRIIDNITSLQNDAVNIDEVKSSLERAGILEKIESLDKGLDTYLYKLYDEEGIELSGGEAQKLAIARALYKNSPIVILDEPTAALDPRAEYDIYTKFLSLVDDKMSVFISHRLSSTKFCDRIVVLRDGEIVEVGTPRELLTSNSYYAELFHMQAEFYIEDATE